MGGTVSGGKQAAQTNKRKYGDDFYVKIGKIGGKIGRTGGFAAKKDCENPNCSYRTLLGQTAEHKVAQCAGYSGGTISRRTGKQYGSS